MVQLFKSSLHPLEDVALPRLPPKATLRSLVSGRFDGHFLEVSSKGPTLVLIDAKRVAGWCFHIFLEFSPRKLGK